MPKLTYSLLGLLALLIVCAMAVLPSTRTPQIVVNMPADAKPLATLAQPGSKVVGPDRAVLWFTVFESARRQTLASQAAQLADQAVNTVYGPLPSHP